MSKDIFATLEAVPNRHRETERFLFEQARAEGCDIQCVAGEVGDTAFVVMEEDGDVLCRLVQSDGSRVSDGQAKAFFRWWGVTPHSGRRDHIGAAHWIVREGPMS